MGEQGPGTECSPWALHTVGTEWQQPYHRLPDVRGTAPSPWGRTETPEGPMPGREGGSRPALLPSSPTAPSCSTSPSKQLTLSHGLSYHLVLHVLAPLPGTPSPASVSGQHPLKNRRVNRAWSLEVQGSRVLSAREGRAVGKPSSGLTVSTLSSGSPGAKTDQGQGDRGW